MDFLLTRLILFQYFVEAGAIAVRRVRKEDLRHVAKATGATAVLSLVCKWRAFHKHFIYLNLAFKTSKTVDIVQQMSSNLK